MSSSNPNLGTHTATKYLWAWGYNDIDGNTSKQVCNTTSNTIQAKQNWWGTPNPGPELFTGSVAYLPCLSNSSPYAGPTWGISTLILTSSILAQNETDDLEALLAIALMLEGEENYEAAISAYRYILANYGNSEYGVFSLARLMACRVNQGNIMVEKDYVKALSINYSRSELGSLALLWLPLIEARSRNIQEALALCDSLIQTFSGTNLGRDAHFEKGTIQLYELNDVEAAKQTFDEFVQVCPNDLLVEHIPIILSNYIPSQAPLSKSIAGREDHNNNIVSDNGYTLSQNYPNPFNPETEIRYQLPEDCHVSLVIYNLLGQKIRTLVDKSQLAGFYSVRWDGKDDQGQAVAAGVYLYIMNAKQFRKVAKMLLLR